MQNSILPINPAQCPAWFRWGLEKRTQPGGFIAACRHAPLASGWMLAEDERLPNYLAMALHGWNGEVTDEFRRELRTLRGVCQAVVELRRGAHSGARLKMEQERLEREREKTEEVVVTHFQRWLKNPEVRDLVCQDYVTPEERERRLREIFGLEPKPPKTPEEALADENEEKQRRTREVYGLPPEESSAAGPESNPVKPNPTRCNQGKPHGTVDSKVCGPSVP